MILTVASSAGIDEIRHVVPASALPRLLPPGTGILLDWDEYVRLTRMASDRVAPMLQVPVAQSLVCQEYTGSFVPGSGLIRLDGTLHVSAVDTAEIPFDSRQVMFQELSVSGKGTVLIRCIEGRECLMVSPGSHSVRATAFVPVDCDSDRIAVSCLFPPFVTGRLHLNFPFEVEYQGCPRREITLPLVPGEELVFSATPGIGAGEGLGGLICDQDLSVTVGGDGLLCLGKFTLRGSLPEVLHIDLPDHNFAEVSGDSVLKFKDRSDGLLVHVKPGTTKLELALSVKQQGLTGEVQAPVLKVREAGLTWGTIRVYAEKAYRVSLQESSGLAMIPAADKSLLSFVFPGPDYRLILSCFRASGTLMQKTELQLFLSGSEALLTGNLIVSDEAGIYRLTLAGLPGAGLSTPGCVSVIEEIDGEYLIMLPEARESLTVAVKAAYQLGMNIIPGLFAKDAADIRGRIEVSCDREFDLSLSSLTGLVFASSTAGRTVLYIDGLYSGKVELSRRKPFITEMTVRSLRLDDSLMEKATCFVGIENGSADELTIVLPEEASGRVFVDFPHKELRHGEKNGVRTVMVVFEKRQTGDLELPLTIEYPAGATGVSSLYIAEAAVHSGFLSVYSSKDAEFQFKPVNLLEVDPDEVPDCGHFTDRRAAAYRYSDISHTLVLGKKTFNRHWQSGGFIGKVDLIAQFSPGGAVSTRADFFCSGNGLQFLPFALPEGAVLISAEKDGSPVKPMKSGSSLMIPLSSDLASISLMYAMEGMTSWIGTTFILQPPLFELPVLQASVGVHVPEHLVVTGFSGDYEALNKIYATPFLEQFLHFLSQTWLFLIYSGLLFKIIVLLIVVVLLGLLLKWMYPKLKLLLQSNLLFPATLIVIAFILILAALTSSGSTVGDTFDTISSKLSGAASSMPGDFDDSCLELQKSKRSEAKMQPSGAVPNELGMEQLEENNKLENFAEDEAMPLVEQSAALQLAAASSPAPQPVPEPKPASVQRPGRRAGIMALPIGFDPQGARFDFTTSTAPGILRLSIVSGKTLRFLGIIIFLAAFCSVYSRFRKELPYFAVLAFVFPLIVADSALTFYLNFALLGLTAGGLSLKFKADYARIAAMIVFLIIVLLATDAFAAEFNEIIVPVQGDPAGFHSPEKVFLTQEQFQALYREAHWAATEEASVYGYFLANASFLIRLHDQEADITAQTDAFCPDKGFTSVVFPYADMALTELSVDGRDTSVNPGSRELLLSSGRHRVIARFKVIPDRGKMISLDFPAFSDAYAHVEVIPGRFDVSDTGRWYRATDNGNLHTFQEGGRVCVLYSEPEQVAASRSVAVMDCVLRVELSKITVAADVTLTGFGKQVLVNLPEGAILTGITSMHATGLRRQPDGYVVDMAAGSEAVLSITYELAKLRSVSLPLPAFKGFSAGGRLLVHSAEGEKMIFSGLSGLRKTDAVSADEYAFEITGEASGLMMIEEKVRKTSVVASYQVGITRKETKINVKAELNNPDPVLVFPVPEGFRVTGVTGGQVVSWHEKGGIVTVYHSGDKKLLLSAGFLSPSAVPGSIDFKGMFGTEKGSSVTLDIDPGLLFTVRGSQGLYQKGSGGLHYSVQDDAFSLNIDVAEKTALISALSTLFVKLTDEKASCSAIVNFSVEHAVFKEVAFDILLPEEILPVVICEKAREISVKRVNDAWRVKLIARFPERESLSVNVSAGIPLASDMTELRLPVISTPVNGTKTHYVLVENDSAIELSEKTASGLTDADAIPYMPSGTDRGMLYRACVAFGDWELLFGITRVVSGELVRSSVQWAGIESFVHDSGFMLSKASYRIRNLTQQFLRVQLPEGSELWQVNADGNKIRPAEENGVLLIPLSRSSAGSLDQMIEICYRTKVAYGWFSARFIPPVILDNIDVAGTFWTITLPGDSQYLKFFGSMHEAETGEAGLEYLRNLMEEVKSVSKIAGSDNLVLQQRARVNMGKLKKQLDTEYDKALKDGVIDGDLAGDVERQSREMSDVMLDDTGEIDRMQEQIFQQNLYSNQQTWTDSSTSSQVGYGRKTQYAPRKALVRKQEIAPAQPVAGIVIPSTGKTFRFKKVGETPKMSAIYIRNSLLRFLLVLLLAGLIVAVRARKPGLLFNRRRI
ncbi:MAG: hypothetical protein PHQ23_00925 [Candidatus Wallbacteria bacterium]|nr:hypothetical protein [Candidatus Wallbacteria bacterium]